MGNASAIFRDLWKSLREKLKEALSSVVPVSLLVFLLSVTPWVDISRHELLVFAGAAILLVVGRADQAAGLIDLLDQTFKKGEGYKGVAFTVPMTSVVGTLVYGFLSNDKRTVKEKA